MARVIPRKVERIARGGTVNSEPSRTKQAFKDQTDINRVLDRASKGASLSHLMNHQGSYGDFSDWDANTYEEMLNKISRGNSIFYDLGAEVRSEFGNNPGAFFEFVNNPENSDRLEEIFPDLAKPGKQLPDVLGAATEALTAAADRILAPDQGSQEDAVGVDTDAQGASEEAGGTPA